MVGAARWTGLWWYVSQSAPWESRHPWCLSRYNVTSPLPVSKSTRIVTVQGTPHTQSGAVMGLPRSESNCGRSVVSERRFRRVRGGGTSTSYPRVPPGPEPDTPDQPARAALVYWAPPCARRPDAVYNQLYHLCANNEGETKSPPKSTDQHTKTAGGIGGGVGGPWRARRKGHGSDQWGVAGRVSAELVAAGKRAGISSDTDLIEVALARFSLEDDPGAMQVRNKGAPRRDVDIELCLDLPMKGGARRKQIITTCNRPLSHSRNFRYRSSNWISALRALWVHRHPSPCVAADGITARGRALVSA